MKVLITGSTGFIGQHLKRELQTREEITDIVGISINSNSTYDKSFLDVGRREFYMDITHEMDVKYLMNSYRPDIIFHLAADTTVKPNTVNPFEIGTTNFTGTHILLEYAPRGSRFVLASSVTVYGEAVFSYLKKEYKNRESDELLPMSVYGATKMAAEGLVNSYTYNDRVNGLVLRLTSTIGSGMTHGVVKDLIARLRQSDSKLDILGEAPGSVRPYMHVNDVVRAIADLGLAKGGYGIFNISTNTSVSIEYIAKAIMNKIGIKKELNWLGEASNWEGDTPCIRIDINRLYQSGFKLEHLTSEEAIQAALEDILIYEIRNTD